MSIMDRKDDPTEDKGTVGFQQRSPEIFFFFSHH